MKKTLSILLLILSTLPVYSQIGAMSSSMRMHQMAVSQHRNFMNTNMNRINYYRNQSISSLEIFKNKVYKVDMKIKTTNAKIETQEKRLKELKEENNPVNEVKIDKINNKITSLNSKLEALNKEKKLFQDRVSEIEKQNQIEREKKQKKKEERIKRKQKS